MSRRQHQVAKGGMFGTTNPQGGISKDTQELLKVMMKESRLTNFQQRKLKESVSGSKPLPTKVPPTNSYKYLIFCFSVPDFLYFVFFFWFYLFLIFCSNFILNLYEFWNFVNKQKKNVLHGVLTSLDYFIWLYFYA